MSGILLKVMEMSGKNLVRENGLKLFMLSCLVASSLDFPEFVRFLFSFRIMPGCIPTPTTGNNTSTGMICRTLTWAGVPQTVRELSLNCRGSSHCLVVTLANVFLYVAVLHL